MPFQDKDIKFLLDELYLKYKKKFSAKDPVWILHNFRNKRDIEIIGLITSCFAYGRVEQINLFINKFLKAVNNKPYEFTSNFEKLKDKKFIQNLNYRFHSSEDLSALLQNISLTLKNYSSLNKLFTLHYSVNDVNIVPAITGFVNKLHSVKPKTRYYSHLLPSPANGSACKRLNLFLRWMVRKDEIDLGIWKGIPKSKLLIPVDTHIYKVSLKLGLVKRKSPDIKFAVELTERLKQFDNDDPVKYDFALCHEEMLNKKSI